MRDIFTTNEKKKNLGIQILRAILSFWVLLFHGLSNRYTKNKFFFKIKLKLYHVPCFTFISFFFNCHLFRKNNYIKIKSRFERLLIPYLVYPISIWNINNLIFFKFHISRFNRYITCYEMYKQLLLGYQFMIVLWFLLSIIVNTFLILIISSTSKIFIIYITYYFNFIINYPIFKQL